MLNAKPGEFSIQVPASGPVKQGSDLSVNVSLQRGSEFKQDVTLDCKAAGIQVSPASVTIKSTDKPDAQFKLSIPRDTKIGEHSISVKGTPNAGSPASAEFNVSVVAL